MQIVFTVDNGEQFGGDLFRAVTHGMVSYSDIDEVIVSIEDICNGLRS